MANRYETLMLFHPEVETEVRREILDRLTGLITDHGGQLIEEDDWGKRTLAYPVQKVSRGHYVRLEYGVQESFIAELERRLRIADGIMKFLTVKLEDDYQYPDEEAA